MQARSFFWMLHHCTLSYRDNGWYRYTPYRRENTTIPTKKSQIFSTAQDNQDAVDINVVQGERRVRKRTTRALDSFQTGWYRSCKTWCSTDRGYIRYRCKRYRKCVLSKDLGTGREQHITITSGTSLSDEDIDRAVQEAAECQRLRIRSVRKAIEARNEADASGIPDRERHSAR